MALDIAVVIGTGGMGRAIVRRVGSGRRVLLADYDERALAATADELTGDGYDVGVHRVDVGDAISVAALADAVAALGPVTRVAHTAGLSPTQAGAERILRVDLAGTAHVLDAFARTIAPGGALVAVASMAGHLAGALPMDIERALATTPAEQLLSLPFLASDAVADPGAAYSIAKRANLLRVQAVAGAYGARGARVNAVSPGVISTPMGREELAGESGAQMRQMIAASATGRVGTPDDIAAAVEFLLGPSAGFITGTDLLVDGGVTAAVRTAGR